jgi:hypothetical protein
LRVSGEQRLQGEYFYEARGETLILEGERNSNGQWLLHESAGGKITGHFKLASSANDLRGEWEPAVPGPKLDVNLERVPRRDDGGKILVLTRYVRGTLKPNAAQKKARDVEANSVDDPTPPDGAELDVRPLTRAERDAPCILEIAFPELAGLPRADAEAAINAAIRRENGADGLQWPERGCRRRHAPTFDVVASERGLFSYCYGLGPRDKPPYNSAHCTTYDIRSGRAIRSADLAAPGAKNAWQELLHAAVTRRFDEGTAETLAPALAEATNLAVGGCGVLITPFADLGRAGGPIGADMYEIPYEKMISLVPASSPLANYARGVARPCRDPRAVTSL